MAAVIAGDENGLRLLAELLAPYLPASVAPGDDRWMDSREAAEYAGTTRGALHKAIGSARGPLRAGVSRREGVVQASGQRRLTSRRAAGVAAEDSGMSQGPRSKRVPGRLNVGVYQRSDGLFEIGFKDGNGRQRWRGPFDTITSARVERAKAVGNAADGRPIATDPRLTFGRAADAWLEA